MIAVVLSLAVVAVSLIVTVFAFLNWRRSHWWVYAAFSLTWLVWSAFYVWTAFLGAEWYNANAATVGQYFVRPMLLWGFGLVAAVMVYRYRSNGSGRR